MSDLMAIENVQLHPRHDANAFWTSLEAALTCLHGEFHSSMRDTDWHAPDTLSAASSTLRQTLVNYLLAPASYHITLQGDSVHQTHILATFHLPFDAGVAAASNFMEEKTT